MTRAIRLADLPPAVRLKIGKPRKSSKSAVLKELRAASAAQKRDAFFSMLTRNRLPKPVAEHRFHAERMWRFDYAWIDAKIALEVEGGIWTQGRHTRGKGVLADMQKYNAAAVLGWRLLRCTPDQLDGLGIQEALRKVLR
jgi:hypothetical protein